MPEKVTMQEKMVELAIAKAKKVKMLQEQGVERIENAEPISGETVKVKRPKAKKDKKRDDGISTPAELKPNASKLKKGFTPSQHDFRELLVKMIVFLDGNGHSDTEMRTTVNLILNHNWEVNEAMEEAKDRHKKKPKGDPTQATDIRYDDS
tara:strand:- start:115 stop:567 length:453 start_codon:yes stop_codon:yes gene_type:complete